MTTEQLIEMHIANGDVVTTHFRVDANGQPIPANSSTVYNDLLQSNPAIAALMDARRWLENPIHDRSVA